MPEFEFDIDAELANLLKTEQEKAPFYVESLERERTELVASFQEHVIAVYSFSGDDFTIEKIASVDVEDAKEREEDLYAQLDELALEDITRHEALLEGEMQVSGEGIYILDFDGEGYPVEELASGETVRGTIDAYNVAPLVSADTSETEGGLDMPGLWVTLKDATVYGPAGDEVRFSECMLVPMSMPGLKFGKVIRRFSEVVSEATGAPVAAVEEGALAPKEPNIREQLAGDLFQERCNEIENDLNYNEYELEELQECRRTYQGELNLYVGDIEPDEQLVITTIEAMLPMGGTIELLAQNVFYNGPTILKFPNSWRVVHGFSVCDSNNGTEQLVHVLPETIKAAFRTI